MIKFQSKADLKSFIEVDDNLGWVTDKKDSDYSNQQLGHRGVSPTQKRTWSKKPFQNNLMCREKKHLKCSICVISRRETSGKKWLKCFGKSVSLQILVTSCQRKLSRVSKRISQLTKFWSPQKKYGRYILANKIILRILYLTWWTLK